MRRSFWWVHKYRHGIYKHSMRAPGTFEQVDIMTANLNRRHGNGGWWYEISEYKKPLEKPGQCEPQAAIEPAAATL